MTTTNNLTSAWNFQRLRREKGLTSQAVADAAGVPLREEYLFEIGGVVSDEIKQKVLTAFHKLTGQSVEEQPTIAMNPISRSQGLIGGSNDLH